MTEVNLGKNAKPRKPLTARELAQFKELLPEVRKILAERSKLTETEKSDLLELGLNKVADKLDELERNAPTEEELKEEADRCAWYLLHGTNDEQYNRIHESCKALVVEELKQAKLRNTILSVIPNPSILARLSASERTFFEHIKQIVEK
jgi:hypothetical protein